MNKNLHAKAGNSTVWSLNPEIGPFSRHIHSYIQDYIKLADQKAAFVFASSTALISFLYQKGIHKRWLKSIPTWSPSDLAACAAMAALFLGIICAVLVVLPRLFKTHRGYVFFRSIIEFESAAKYAEEISAKSENSLAIALLMHAYDLAKVCSKKYAVLSIAIWSSSIGVGLSILYLLFCA